MPRYVELFDKVTDGIASCNEADGYSECIDCTYRNECEEAGELYPGLGMCSPLRRDIHILRNAMKKLDAMEVTNGNS